MDTSRLKQIHKHIITLENKVKETDSKKESRRLEKQIEDLESEFEDALDEVLEDFPTEVTLKIKVDKVVDFDITDFRYNVLEELLIREDISDIDLNRELKNWVKENFEASYEIDDSDITIEFIDNEYK